MKKTKGISLIVLIITIVVIIILATAIIVNLAQTNIIAKANEAVVKQDFKTLQEELDLYIADRYSQTKGEFDYTTLNATKTTTPSVYEILTSLEKSKYKDDVTIVNGKIVLSDDMSELQKTWAMEVINNSSNNIPTEPETPEGKNTPVVGIDTIVTDSNSTITGKDFAYNNPVIPVGFKASTSGASWQDTDSDGIVDGWNSGLVIADANENEFVWVPVDGTDVTYEKRFDEYPKNSSITSVSDDTEALPTLNGTTIDENAQISTYGGFYIGRYEAGVPANQTSIDGTSASTSNKAGIPVTKQGATVWTRIDYTNSNTNAKSFVNTTNVKSGLVTGTQWDTTMKWIENSGISVTDSRAWGNYSDSIAPANVDGYGTKQTAGYSEYWKAKNIYDLAGNTWEWTGEIYNSSYRIRCGGNYDNSGSDYPASCRSFIYPSNALGYISFRLVLYVM